MYMVLRVLFLFSGLLFFIPGSAQQTLDSMPTVKPPLVDTASVVKPQKESDKMPVAKPQQIPSGASLPEDSSRIKKNGQLQNFKSRKKKNGV
jgi:hypothetical protein